MLGIKLVWQLHQPLIGHGVPTGVPAPPPQTISRPASETRTVQLDFPRQFFVLHPPLLLLQSWLVSLTRGRPWQPGQPQVVSGTLRPMLGLLQGLSQQRVSTAPLAGPPESLR